MCIYKNTFKVLNGRHKKLIVIKLYLNIFIHNNIKCVARRTCEPYQEQKNWRYAFMLGSNCQ